MGAQRLASALVLLALPAGAAACALHGGMGFGSGLGLGVSPHHFAEDWAPHQVPSLPAPLGQESAEARMERQREMMLARYPTLRPETAALSAIPPRD